MLQIRSVIYGYTNVYAIIMVVNTLLDVTDTLGDLRLHRQRTALHRLCRQTNDKTSTCRHCWPVVNVIGKR